MLTMHPDARRYEASTHPEVLIAGWLAALGWLEGLGWERVHEATLAAAAACRVRLAAIDGVRVLGGPAATSGLVAFTVDGWAPEPAAAALATGVRGRGEWYRPRP
jgi:cysteine desulfurase/selenocysteine lyase